MAKFHLTRKAVSDLDSIWEYTLETWSEKQADEYYDLIINTFHAIAEHPCHLDREYTEIHPGLFRRTCRKHMIFYRTVENGDVEIVRILHEKMDIGDRLK